MMRTTSDSILKRRINLVLLFFLIAFAALLGRLFVLQIVYHGEYANLASRQHGAASEGVSNRGGIFVRDKSGDLLPFAINKNEKILAVSPKDVKNPEALMDALVKTFDLPREFLSEKLSKKDDPHEILQRDVKPEIAEKINALNLRGLFFEEEKKRAYPQKTVGAHILGFASKENNQTEGRYGLEKYYENKLNSGFGAFGGASSPVGFLAAIGRRIINPPENGASLILTLDFNIQSKAEAVLDSVKSRWGAVSGVVIVLEPKTGRILAMAGSPVFDPNAYFKEKDFSVFLNNSVESMYELGSVLKPIAMAGVLEEKLVSANSVYHDQGEVKIGGYVIKNFDGKAYEDQTMTQVLEKSLNTGAVYVSRLLGKERQVGYLKSFGFGQKTGIDLPGEVSGDISNLDNMRDIDFATASFGQGIAVTPIQLAMAIGAVANGGILMRPYIAEEILDDSGNKFKKEPELVRHIISKETAEELTKMLVSTVRSGFENRAGVKGYFVAGKTGTAQIPRRDGRGYDPDRVIHTFVGYAPAFDPKFLILLQLNEPKGNRFAANTLTPAFHDLAEYILNYYEIPPDEK